MACGIRRLFSFKSFFFYSLLVPFSILVCEERKRHPTLACLLPDLCSSPMFELIYRKRSLARSFESNLGILWTNLVAFAYLSAIVWTTFQRWGKLVRIRYISIIIKLTGRFWLKWIEADVLKKSFWCCIELIQVLEDEIWLDSLEKWREELIHLFWCSASADKSVCNHLLGSSIFSWFWLVDGRWAVSDYIFCTDTAVWLESAAQK